MLPHEALRERIKLHLFEEIQLGNLAIGKAFKLKKMSKRLGVDEEKIRPIITLLEFGGVVVPVSHELFVVPKFDKNEVSELYRTVAELEVLALESVRLPEIDICGLKQKLLQLQRTYTLSGRIAAHFEFHRLLTKSSNKILNSILDNLWTRMHFYEQHFVTQASFYDPIDNQNEGIIRAIEENNIPTAALILKMKWLSILDYILLKF